MSPTKDLNLSYTGVSKSYICFISSYVGLNNLINSNDDDDLAVRHRHPFLCAVRNLQIPHHHLTKTAVHNLSWLWINILCSHIKGFGNDFHFQSWLCNLRESLPNHCCGWLSWEWNQMLKLLYNSIHSASVMEILLWCAPVMEILLCCSKPKCERLT